MKIIFISFILMIFSSCESNNSESKEKEQLPDIYIETNGDWYYVVEGLDAKFISNNDRDDISFITLTLNDSVIDTLYNHPFNFEVKTLGLRGLYDVKMIGYDDNKNFALSNIIKLFVVKNKKPIANFKSDIYSGLPISTFTFNPSSTTDIEDQNMNLRFFWDFDNDGIWDIENESMKNVSHTFSEIGYKTVRLRVYDTSNFYADYESKVNILETDSMIDIDGNVYKTVKIDEQWWMMENLRVSKFRDGIDISLIESPSEWVQQRDAAYSYSNGSESTSTEYGFLYNDAAANDARNIAPEGWRIPSVSDYEQLNNFLGEDAGQKLMSNNDNYWDGHKYLNMNLSGFNAVPAGRRYRTGDYNYFNLSSILYTSEQANDRIILYQISGNNSYISQYFFRDRAAYSIRCIKE